MLKAESKPELGKPKFRVFSFGGPDEMTAWLDEQAKQAGLEVQNNPENHDIKALFLHWPSIRGYPLRRLKALKIIYVQVPKVVYPC